MVTGYAPKSRFLQIGSIAEDARTPRISASVAAARPGISHSSTRRQRQPTPTVLGYLSNIFDGEVIPKF